MKRLITLLLALCMMIPATAAWGEGEVELNLVRATFNLTEADPSQVQKVEDAINAYLQNRLNVRIHLREIGSNDYREKVREALDRG